MAEQKDLFISRRLDALILLSVHIEDITVGGQARDWTRILKRSQYLQNAGHTVTSIQKRFVQLRHGTVRKYPFPMPQDLSQENEIPEALKGRNLEASMEGLTNKGTEMWENCKISEILKAAEVVSPMTLFSAPCLTLLGYAPERLRTVAEENFSVFLCRYLQGKGILSHEKLQEYESFERSVGVDLEDSHKFVQKAARKASKKYKDRVRLEMGALLGVLKDSHTARQSQLMYGMRACSIMEVCFYPRALVDTNGDKIRDCVSDYDLMRMYEYGLKHNFPFDLASTQDWLRLAHHCKISGVTGKSAYWDFTTLLLPRLGYLMERLAPELRGGKYVIDLTKDTQTAKIALYNKLSVVSVLQIMRVLANTIKWDGVCYVKSLGEDKNDVVQACLKFSMSILEESQREFRSTREDFQTAQEELVNDVLKHWFRFYHDVNGKRFE